MQTDAVATERQDLAGLEGNSLLPLAAGSKACYLQGWPDLRFTVRDLMYHFGNIGLLLGFIYPFGGFLELDIDDPKALSTILDPLRAAGLDPVAIIRSGGQHHGWKLLFWLRPRAWTWVWSGTLASSATAVRGDRSQTVIPPSRPPSPGAHLPKEGNRVFKPYQWVEALPPFLDLQRQVEAQPQDFEKRLYQALFGRDPKVVIPGEGVSRRGEGLICSPSLSKSREGERSALSPAPTAGPKTARAQTAPLEAESDLWTRPEVAWLPILREAYRKTYPGAHPPGADIFQRCSGVSAMEYTTRFCDPFEKEENPSCVLLRNPGGEWVLRSYRDRDADGACFMSVQQAYLALRSGRKPLRTIPKREQRQLTRDLVWWLGCVVNPPEEVRRPWWTSDSKLGRIAAGAHQEIVNQAISDRRAVLDCRRLGKSTKIDFRYVAAALRLLCAVGLLARDLCTDDFAIKQPNRKQYHYTPLFDEVDQADIRLSDLGVDPDRPWTWRKALAALKERTT